MASLPGLRLYSASTILVCLLLTVTPRSALAQEGTADGGEPDAGESAQPHGDGQEPISLESLLGSFSEARGLSATFTEEKEMDLLAKPLTSTGTLYYAAPDKLVRRTESPKKSTVLIDGDTLSFSEGGQKRDTINLDDHPVVREFVDGFRHVLAGDVAALKEHYSLELDSDGQAWTLTLIPKSDKGRELVKEVVVKGTGDQLETLIVKETIGDVTTTTFSDVQRDRTFSDEERARLFRVP